MIAVRAGRPPRIRHAAQSHATAASSVLLSVRSQPNGMPVHHAPNAYYCISGPRTNPPTSSSPMQMHASRRACGERPRR